MQKYNESDFSVIFPVLQNNAPTVMQRTNPMKYKRLIYISLGILTVFLVGYIVFTWKQLGGGG